MAGIVQALGGLGLFLLGMTIMTGALRSLADERLRDFLARSVKSPWKGAVTGAIATALLQSSSATTVAAVGFVGAGLLSFSESLGIIFGANIGTTATGWLVALLGFKLNLGQMLLPLILVGVLFRLSGRPRLEQIGMAVAGFGLVFVGIGMLQDGLGELQGRITPEQFPPDTIPGRLLLMLMGLIITVITQSSSAGVATALAAVHTNTISLNQAAAMVIGMDLGTTATAAVATVGGNVSARRTGFAHVIYNAMTALAAFLLLTPYMSAVEMMIPGARLADPELVLVGFHTFFNALGVVAVLPFTSRFADFVVRLIPERGNPLTSQLDRSLLAHSPTALRAVDGTLGKIANSLLAELGRRLQDVETTSQSTLLANLDDAIEKTNDYLQEMAARFQGAPPIRDYLACIHVLDHLRRLDRRLRDDKRLRRCRDDQELSEISDRLSVAIDRFANATRPLTAEQAVEIRAINHELKTDMRTYRARMVEKTASGEISTADAVLRMDTTRWLRRVGYHIWRIAYHWTAPDAQTDLLGPRASVGKHS